MRDRSFESLIIIEENFFLQMRNTLHFLLEGQIIHVFFFFLIKTNDKCIQCIHLRFFNCKKIIQFFLL